MPLYRRNGTLLNPDASFEGKDGVQHLTGWIKTASAEELTEEGIEVLTEQPRPEDRFYYVTDNGDGTYTAASRDLTLTIAAARATRIALCWSVMTSKMQDASFSVSTSAGMFNFGMDDTSRDNMDKALMGVALAITPNPRPWTPKGQSAPVMLTHDDLKEIGRQMGAKYDSFVQAYLMKKAAIKQATGADDRATLAMIESYDVVSGWPT